MARCLALAFAVLLFSLGTAVRAEAPPNDDYRISLLTVSPGDALLTRAGHAAIVVTERWSDGREVTTVYNYGDADFDDPWLGLEFAWGQPRFFVSVVGDLYAAVEYFGLHQNRDVWVQDLALTPAQAEAVATRLAEAVLPENREYDYHYLTHTCTTELRTLLDDVLGGAIEAQLGPRRDEWTVREYQQLTFDGDLVMPLLADAGFGRRHDEPISMHYAMMWPRRMREYMQLVQVPDPAGGDGTVPLAGPPQIVAERGGPAATESPTKLTWYVAGIGGVLFLLVGVGLRGRGGTRAAGGWLLAWALPIGTVGLAITVLSLTSTVRQLHDNELVLSLLATDLLLVPTAVRWLRGRREVSRWVQGYATIRLVVVGLAVAARAVGPFIQQPWVIPPASLACGVGLWLVVHGAATSRD